MNIPILHEHDGLLVINKPSGILVHKSKSTSVLEKTVLDWLYEIHGQRYAPIHRLDRGTSGILLLAKNAEITRQYSRLFEQRAAKKVYLAIVRGFAVNRVIEYPLRHLTREGLTQEALTLCTVLRTAILPYASDRYETSRYSLVELCPETGRTHQLRRHMKHVHHPILGDVTYGHGVHNRIFRERLNCSRLLLHHARLEINRPGESPLIFNAPLDSKFARIARDIFLF